MTILRGAFYYNNILWNAQLSITSAFGRDKLFAIIPVTFVHTQQNTELNHFRDYLDSFGN